ncbi:AraC family transcriptional regulator [Prevotella sp. HUN102]|uniref:AraC family transcriptional regulator n=1 Tax=Prevotella sp. HUN102 TaxID=1392486 RepID=UPI000492213A|nr:helix-turn-helix domain-containing protein [Prevotella sp. HUN102]
MTSKKDFKLMFTTDFYQLCSSELSDCCAHIICTAGEGGFVYNESCFHLQKNSLAVISHPDEVSNLAATDDFHIEMFAADYKFLNNILPSNNYSIGGSMSLYQNPVLPLSADNAQKFLDDIHHLRRRINDDSFLFYQEIIASMCLTMMYDIFEFHAIHYGSTATTDRANYIVKEFLQLLSTGITRTERNASYFADRLNVSMKYLSSTVKRTTGNTVTSYIDRVTIPILRRYLDDEKLSFSQIADIMNFSSLSYFSRYCIKHLGVTPSEYRIRRQPKKM